MGLRPTQVDEKPVLRLPTNFSSRPKRSVVERSAVSLPSRSLPLSRNL
jgi:hypothetical protein